MSDRYIQVTMTALVPEEVAQRLTKENRTVTVTQYVNVDDKWTYKLTADGRWVTLI